MLGNADWEARVAAEVKTYFVSNKMMQILPMNQKNNPILLITDRDLLQLQRNVKTKQ